MDVLGLPVRTAETVAAPVVRTVPCDACDGSGVRMSVRCGYCDGEGRRPLHLFELRVDLRDREERDPLAAAVDRRGDVGSYHELDRALAELRAADRGAHRGLLEAVDSELAVPAELESALSFVVVRMPEPVKVPAEVRANARLLRDRRTRAKGRAAGPALVRRDREIRRLVRQGKPAQWVAQEYGLSVSSVYAIVRAGELTA